MRSASSPRRTNGKGTEQLAASGESLYTCLRLECRGDFKGPADLETVCPRCGWGPLTEFPKLLAKLHLIHPTDELSPAEFVRYVIQNTLRRPISANPFRLLSYVVHLALVRVFGDGAMEIDNSEEVALEAVLLGLPPSTEREAELVLLLS